MTATEVYAARAFLSGRRAGKRELSSGLSLAAWPRPRRLGRFLTGRIQSLRGGSWGGGRPKFLPASR